MSRPDPQSTPYDRRKARSRVRTLTRASVLAAAGLTAVIGVVVAKEHSGSSATTATGSSGSGTGATTTPTTSSSTSSGSTSSGSTSSGSTSSGSSSSNATSPSITYSRPSVTSGGSSR